MENLAYELLNSIGLPTPKVYSVESALKCSDSTNFYLRYRKGMKSSSGIIDYQTFADSIETFSSQIEREELLQIEETIDTHFGACVYFVNGELYGEIVHGQLVDVLRRGLCDIRFCYNYSRKELNIYSSDVCQYNVFNDEELTKIKNHINKILQELNSLNNKFSDLLVEILLTNDRCVYCDAKKPNMEDFMNAVNTTIVKRENYHKHLQKLTKKIDINEPFDVDIISTFQDDSSLSLRLKRGSLLTHFVTRNWVNIDNIIVK